MPTTQAIKDEKATATPLHRDDYKHLETIDHLGLVHDRNDHLTPLDVLFDPKQSSARPRPVPREVL